VAGRPKKTFTEKDIEQIKVLARCHCPDTEIAAFMGVAERTIQRHFGALLKEEREAGRANLRSWQFAAAQRGNITMMIWLGKQLLGQRDKSDVRAEMAEPIVVRSPDGELTTLSVKRPE
jgi:hypothetical protein